jgi:outer membrane lipoprotein-sorting protein
MRTLATTAVSLVMMSASTLALSAQQGLSRFDGVWHQLEIRVVRPDSTVMRPPSQGVSIISNGHFVQVYVALAQQGVQQSSRPTNPTTAEEKAARYDLLTANEGTFEVHDSTIVIHYGQGKSPATVGSTTTVPYRFRGDTLWQTVSSRWAKDTSKVVRTTFKFVRQK